MRSGFPTPLPQATHRRRPAAPPPLPPLPPLPQERFARKNEDQLLCAAFERLDSNRDGQITVDELQAYFEAMGHKVKKVGRTGVAVLSSAVRLTPPDLPLFIPAASRRRSRT